MRGGLLTVGLAAGMLFLAGIGSSAGGVAVTGAGRGYAFAPDGAYNCANAPFAIEILYLPGNAAALKFSWVGIETNCPAYYTGGSTLLGMLSYDTSRWPPASWTWSCQGSELSGLTCASGSVFVGPYSGPGLPMSLTKRSALEHFDGVFVAV